MLTTLISIALFAIPALASDFTIDTPSSIQTVRLTRLLFAGALAKCMQFNSASPQPSIGPVAQVPTTSSSYLPMTRVVTSCEPHMPARGSIHLTLIDREDLGGGHNGDSYTWSKVTLSTDKTVALSLQDSTGLEAWSGAVCVTLPSILSLVDASRA